MQVRWAPTGTTAGACGNGHGREQKCNVVWARATHDTRTSIGASWSATLFERKPHTACERVETAGMDSIRAQTSSGCTDGRPWILGAN
jgi:hypothetical protein